MAEVVLPNDVKVVEIDPSKKYVFVMRGKDPRSVRALLDSLQHHLPNADNILLVHGDVDLLPVSEEQFKDLKGI